MNARNVALLALLLPLGAYALAGVPARMRAAEEPVTQRYDVAGCGPVGSVPRDVEGVTGRAMILCLLNFERRRHGLIGLSRNALLERASERHSADMETRRFFEHDTPEGVTADSRIRATGYDGARTGENIAWGEGTKGSPAEIVDAWMHSRGHREAILQPAYREVGIGIVVGAAPRAKPVSRSAVTYTTDFGG